VFDSGKIHSVIPIFIGELCVAGLASLGLLDDTISGL